MNELAGYLQSYYGRCRTMDVSGQCACLRKRNDMDAQRECANWLPSKAETWKSLEREQDKARDDRRFAPLSQWLVKNGLRGHTVAGIDLLLERRAKG